MEYNEQQFYWPNDQEGPYYNPWESNFGIIERTDTEVTDPGGEAPAMPIGVYVVMCI